MVASIKSLAEFNEKINSGKTVFIDFWATWCGPCRVISPVFEKLAAATPDAEFYKIDVDEDVAQEVGIRAMPTFQGFRDGEKKGEVVGANPPALQNLIKNLVSA
ncbi:thioredoxin [Cantharellus anzutake]|uniref:thioredoxin n=1 Tax=Cantharellus anzutake TaxID=1750568 RepID=UPI001905A2E5|nr:thioredoxin [Cantharellus anzutake]KAF8333170.1 thioredoxin [Cantharellus anzutake]